MADRANLNAGTIIAQRIFQLALNRMLIACLFHINEIDNNQAREITKTQLAPHFLCSFQVGFQRGFFNVALSGGFAGVDVNRYQRFGLVHHQIATGF